MIHVFSKGTICIVAILTVILVSCKFSNKSRFKGFESHINIKNIVNATGRSDQKLTEIHFPPEASMSFDYSKELEDLTFVPLQTTNESKIGKISDIFFSEDRIFIVDREISECIFIFNSHGRYLAKIDPADTLTNENGAKHFFSASYFYKAQEIILHDDKKDSLYYYNKNGEFTRKERCYISFSDFKNVKNTDSFVFLSLYGENEHLELPTQNDLYMGTSDGRITNIAPNAIYRNHINSNYYYDDNLCASPDRLFYTPIFSDTVYQVDSKNLNVYAKYKLSFPGENINSVVIKEGDMPISKLVRLRNSHKYYSFRGKILDGNDGISYFEGFKNGQIGYFYSSNSGKIVGGDISVQRSVKDSVYMSFYQYPITSSNGKFVSIIEPEYFDHTQHDLLSGRYKAAIKDFSKTSNPILVFYKIKRF